MSDFDVRDPQRVRFGIEKIHCGRFWIETFPKCQILKEWLHSQNRASVPWKRQILQFSCFSKIIFLKWKIGYVSDFEKKKNTKRHFLKLKNTKRLVSRSTDYKMSEFKPTFWTRVIFWSEFFKKWQLLKVLVLQFSRFTCDHQTSSLVSMTHLRWRHVLW